MLKYAETAEPGVPAVRPRRRHGRRSEKVISMRPANITSGGLGWQRRSGLLQRLRRCRLGATTVEMAMIMPVFMMLFLAIIETSIFYFRASVLNGAVRDAARLLKTGQAQASNDAESAFITKLCSSVALALDCGDVVASARAYPDVASAAAAANAALFVDGQATAQPFNAGAPNDYVVVSVGYRYTFFTPMIGRVFSPDGSGTITAVSSSVIHREP
jgi:Flp pilus assembly protein TadG